MYVMFIPEFRILGVQIRGRTTRKGEKIPVQTFQRSSNCHGLYENLLIK